MQPARNPLPEHFSLYLDVARFLAAVFVVVEHLIQYGLITPAAAAFVPDLGREAVMIFFVMSGFVIMYSVDTKHATLGGYAVARAARIYSVALPALAASFIVTALVVHFSSATVTTSYQLGNAHLYLPFHMLFAGEFWNLAETPPWLMPYWSLSYEVWYYALFGAAWFLRGLKRLLVCGAIVLAAGFKLWLLLPVWLSGVWLYRRLQRGGMTVARARAGWALSVAALCAFKLADADHYLHALGIAVWPFPGLHLGSADRYLADYPVCLLILANFACARHAAFPLAGAGRAIRALAAHTFTLYLFHGLVLMLWKTFVPWGVGTAANLAALLLLVVALTWLAGLLAEPFKAGIQRAGTRLLACLPLHRPVRA